MNSDFIYGLIIGALGLVSISFLGLGVYYDIYKPYFLNPKISLTQRIQTGLLVILVITAIVFTVLFWQKQFNVKNDYSSATNMVHNCSFNRPTAINFPNE